MVLFLLKFDKGCFTVICEKKNKVLKLDIALKILDSIKLILIKCFIENKMEINHKLIYSMKIKKKNCCSFA